MKEVKLTQKLTETGLMLALATVLFFVKIAQLPYGGEITFAEMLPLIIIAYRYDFVWGLLTGFVFGLIQMVFGLNALSYATSFTAAVAIVLLDYLFAFMTVSIGAVFKNLRSGSLALGLGAFFVCALRYIFHVFSGCTVWAGLSIPTSDAFVYSLIYNATYMIPETIITVLAGFYIGSVIDFKSVRLRPVVREGSSISSEIMSALAGLSLLGIVAGLIAVVFPNLQNAETGAFDITGINNVSLTAVLIIFGVGILLFAVFTALSVFLKKRARA